MERPGFLRRVAAESGCVQVEEDSGEPPRRFRFFAYMLDNHSACQDIPPDMFGRYLGQHIEEYQTSLTGHDQDLLICLALSLSDIQPEFGGTSELQQTSPELTDDVGLSDREIGDMLSKMVSSILSAMNGLGLDPQSYLSVAGDRSSGGEEF